MGYLKSGYSEGCVIKGDGIEIVVTRQNHKPKEILVTPRLPVTYIEVGSQLSLTDVRVARTISRLICKVAERVASDILIPEAHEVTASTGATPTGWKISRGMRRLGYCDSRGIIALSCMLVFVPRHLRRFVICHELAHLTEMNHGKHFHEICNSYCDGKERELIAALRAFRWP